MKMFTGLLACLALAMAPSGVHAQGTFEDCSDSNTFTSIATTGILLTDISSGDNSRQDVALPFDFPFFDGNSFDTVRVDQDVELSFLGEGTREIAVASNSDADATNVYQQNGSNSVVISWENFNIGDEETQAESNSNAQVTLFSNGDVTFCYGSGDTGDDRAIVARMSARIGSNPTERVNVDTDPFTDGISDTWPTNNLCVCYDAGSATLFPTEAPMAAPTTGAPTEAPTNQPSTSSEPTISECFSRSTKSPGKGKGKGGKGMKMQKTTKTASPTGCFETKSPGKGMMMGGKGMNGKGRGKGMMMG